MGVCSAGGANRRDRNLRQGHRGASGIQRRARGELWTRPTRRRTDGKKSFGRGRGSMLTAELSR